MTTERRVIRDMIQNTDVMIDQISNMKEIDFTAFIEQLREIVDRNKWRRIIDREFYEVKIGDAHVHDKAIDLRHIIDIMDDARSSVQGCQYDLESKIDKLKEILKKK